ncbi:MAG: hypothetical protein MPK13_01130 [Gammaproteobacteria bacterium]|nr:hypothetical protein [Gammaproteobacteria bacterium]
MMADKKSPEKPDKPFFVGYLPMPAALERFYWPLALLLLAAAAAAGHFWAMQQQSAGEATWRPAAPEVLRGVLTLRPYPALHRFHPQNPGRIESVLLVGQGKHAANLPARFDGRAVAIRGAEILRGNWRMLEIPAVTESENEHENSGDGTISLAEIPDENALRAELGFESLGGVVFRGEIADSKCFLGVMKPGAGAVHKACAELCLLGGIPPMLVVQNAQREKFGYLLLNTDGTSAAKSLAPLAAESVQVRGELLRQGDLLFVKMNAGGLARF